MSFGVGLGDIAILLKGLGKIISALKSEAVDGFRRYKKTYQSFVRTVEGLTKLVQSNSLQKDPDIKHALRKTRRLLRHFFGRIAKFERHLGPDRAKKSLLGAITKMKWTQHTKMLTELRQDLDRELGVLYLLVATKPRLSAVMAVDIPRRREYCVVLVTGLPKHSYGTFSDGFCTPTDRPQAIPWTKTDLASIPPMLPSLRFRRHFALCLVPKNIWGSRTKTIFQKLDGQMFWDYHGDDTDYSKGTVWPSDRVYQINAIQDLGVALSGEDAANLCTEYYIELRRNWDYFNIWWNAADFAISLACLLVQDTQVQVCRQIMQRLDQLRLDEVIQPRSQSCDANRLRGIATTVTGCAATLLSGGLLAPVAMPAAMGGVAYATGSVVTKAALEEGGGKRKRLRDKAISNLQNSFPRLINLFGTTQL